MTTRRDFLGGSVGLAAALPSLLRASAVFADPAAAGRVRALVDWHSHFVSRAEIAFLARRKQAPRLVTDSEGVTRLINIDTVSAAAGVPSELAASDVAARLNNLDGHGIERQLLTHTVAMGFDATIPVDELRVLYRAFNDELAEVVRHNRPRFLAVAALPSADARWAAEELTRAHRDLGFIGGSLPLNAFATLDGARTLAPLFAAAQKLGSHFFVHRGPASERVPGQPPPLVPTDTVATRWSLINNAHLAAGAITLGVTDFLDPYPDVSVEIIMLGGFFPYLLDTIVTQARADGVQDPLARLRRIYLDTGPYAARNPEWVALAAAKLGADRILFGTDYGVGGGRRGDVGPALDTLDKTLTVEQRGRIYFDNTRELLASKGIS
jgi:predicted TIM-barrel fold metal-dependent hydrolase